MSDSSKYIDLLINSNNGLNSICSEILNCSTENLKYNNLDVHHYPGTHMVSYQLNNSGNKLIKTQTFDYKNNVKDYDLFISSNAKPEQFLLKEKDDWGVVYLMKTQNYNCIFFNNFTHDVGYVLSKWNDEYIIIFSKKGMISQLDWNISKVKESILGD